MQNLNGVFPIVENIYLLKKKLPWVHTCTCTSEILFLEVISLFYNSLAVLGNEDVVYTSSL